MLAKYEDRSGWIVLARTHIGHLQSGAGVPAFISWALAVSLSLLIALQISNESAAPTTCFEFRGDCEYFTVECFS